MANFPTGRASRIPSGATLREEDASDMVSRSYELAERCITDYPASAVGVAFGAGLGLGICVGLALKSTMIERKSPQRRMTERLGRQVLEAVTSVLPDAVTSRIRQ